MEKDVIEIASQRTERFPENSDFSAYGFWIGFFKAFVSAFSRCFDLKGRTSRFDCWGFFFGYVLTRLTVGFGLHYLENRIGYNENNLILFRLLFSLAMMWVLVTVMIRRLHDVNMRGWWVLLSFVPFIVSFLKGDKEANRFGSAPVTNEKKALTAVLITALPVLGLFLFIFIIGMIGGYTRGLNRFKEIKTIDQIRQTVANVHILFSSATHYEALDNPSVMYQVGVYGNDICRNAECSRPVNPYGGPVSMKAVDGGFEITYGGLPAEACVALLNHTDWATVLRKFRGVSINASGYFVSPIREKAYTACKAGTNTISWSVL